jgi:hypothetical protein
MKNTGEASGTILPEKEWRRKNSRAARKKVDE